MTPLPAETPDAGLIAFVDRWAAFLEVEDYAAAHAVTAHEARQGWTPELMRATVKTYGDARPGQKVTVAGVAGDVAQCKEVSRWENATGGVAGQIWYDLNIDGVASDLTALFDVVRVEGGLAVRLHDIHVM